MKRLDHVNLLATDVAACRAFSTDVLGFRHYEGIVLDDGSEAGAWLSLSIAAHELIYVADARHAQGRLHHLAFWVDTREEVLRAADIFIEHLVPIEFAPSKHTISQGLFLYVFEPGGNRIEITSGGYFVYDPDQEPVLWTQAERARGQAWEVKTVESFHYYGTPPAHDDDRAYVARCRDSMPPVTIAATITQPDDRPACASRCNTASMRANPPFAPSSTPYCIVVSRSSVVAKLHRLRQLRLVAEILELERLQMVLERLHEPLGRVDLAELALDDAVGGAEAIRAAGANVHLLDDRAVTPPFGDQLRVGPDGEDVRARRVEDALDADLELVRGGDRSGWSFIFSGPPSSRASRIFASSAAVSVVTAKATGHMEPWSSCALSLKPSIAYRSLNFPASRK